MSLLIQAIVDNNDGVRMIDSGQELNGIAAFQRSLTTMHTFNQSLENSTSHHAASAANPQYSQVDLVQQHLVVDACAEQRTSGHMHVYTLPFALLTRENVNPSSCPVASESMLSMLSMAVLFNIAVVTHTHGSQTGKSLVQHQAIRIYELIIQIEQIGGNGENANHLLQCLTLNNMAQLHYECSEFEKSYLCLELMADLLRTNDCLDDYLDEFEANEIRANVFHRRVPNEACAA
jgi:hypothetical protein